MRVFILFLVLMSCLLGLGVCVYGQADEQPASLFRDKSPTRVWQGNVDELRQSINILLKQNTSREEENQQLTQEILKLKDAIEQAANENERLLSEPPRLQGLIKEAETKAKVVEKEIKLLSGQISVLEKEKNALAQELTSAEKKLQPYQDEVANLNLQKESLSLDIANGQSLKEKEIQEIKAQIEKVGKEALDAETAIKDTEIQKQNTLNEKSQSLDDIKRLTKENQDLNLQLSKATRDLAVSTKGLESVKKENTNLAQAAGLDSAKKNSEKQKWQSQNDGLQAQINETLKDVATTIPKTPVPAAAPAETQELANRINSLNKEVEDLKKQANDLNEAAMLVAREKAMAEDLLEAQKARMSAVVVEAIIPPEIMAKVANTEEAMAYAYAKQGLYEKSIAKYQEAIKKGGNKRNIYFNLGFIYYQLGDLKAALKNYKRVLSIAPSDEEARANVEALRQELSNPSP